MSRKVLNMSREGDSITPLGQPVPVLYHSQSKEVLPHVQMELLMLQFVPVAPCAVAGHH